MAVQECFGRDHMKIEEVLVRRSDLSTFLVHLTRKSSKQSAKDRLISILTSHTLKAVTPFGPAVERLKAKKQPTESQKCVCFTETPLEHVYLLTQQIDNRKYKFEPYGIAISKKQGRKNGVNPIWYLDITIGHDWLTQPLEELIDEAIAKGKYDDSPLSKLTPFIEQMGSGNPSSGKAYRKEFWWEREWRHQGDMSLFEPLIVLCPMKDKPDVVDALEKQRADQKFIDEDVAFIDPMWNLEQIIGRLAGFKSSDLGAM